MQDPSTPLPTLRVGSTSSNQLNKNHPIKHFPRFYLFVRPPLQGWSNHLTAAHPDDMTVEIYLTLVRAPFTVKYFVHPRYAPQNKLPFIKHGVRMLHGVEDCIDYVKSRGYLLPGDQQMNDQHRKISSVLTKLMKTYMSAAIQYHFHCQYLNRISLGKKLFQFLPFPLNIGCSTSHWLLSYQNALDLVSTGHYSILEMALFRLFAVPPSLVEKHQRFVYGLPNYLTPEESHAITQKSSWKYRSPFTISCSEIGLYPLPWKEENGIHSLDENATTTPTNTDSQEDSHEKSLFKPQTWDLTTKMFYVVQHCLSTIDRCCTMEFGSFNPFGNSNSLIQESSGIGGIGEIDETGETPETPEIPESNSTIHNLHATPKVPKTPKSLSSPNKFLYSFKSPSKTPQSFPKNQNLVRSPLTPSIVQSNAQTNLSPIKQFLKSRVDRRKEKKILSTPTPSTSADTFSTPTKSIHGTLTSSPCVRSPQRYRSKTPSLITPYFFSKLGPSTLDCYILSHCSILKYVKTPDFPMSILFQDYPNLEEYLSSSLETISSLRQKNHFPPEHLASIPRVPIFLNSSSLITQESFFSPHNGPWERLSTIFPSLYDKMSKNDIARYLHWDAYELLEDTQKWTGTLYPQQYRMKQAIFENQQLELQQKNLEKLVYQNFSYPSFKLPDTVSKWWESFQFDSMLTTESVFDKFEQFTWITIFMTIGFSLISDHSMDHFTYVFGVVRHVISQIQSLY